MSLYGPLQFNIERLNSKCRHLEAVAEEFSGEFREAVAKEKDRCTRS
jgi:hypothetical protein